MSTTASLARCAVALFALLTLPQQANALPEGFQDTEALGGLVHPTTFAFAADGRVFVAEKSGIIKVFDGLGDGSATVFADLRTQVHNFWDRGLLGLALHPSFPAVPHVFVLYTYDAPPGGVAPTWGKAGETTDGCPTPPGATADGCVVQGRLSRLTADGDSWDGQETVLITDWCQQYPSHSIGTVAFGPDGALYLSAGDGASFNFVDYGQAGNPKNPCGDPPAGVGGTMTPPSAEGGALRAQDVLTPADPVSLDGAILRVDPATGGALPDNPLVGGAAAGDDRIIAFGLRNPFRFAFRPGTSQIWIGDVGWSSWEELNVVDDAGDAVVENFGWPCYEGAGKQSGYAAAGLSMCQSLYDVPGAVTPPTFAYAHKQAALPGDPCGAGGSGSAVGNVAFYQGGTWPAAYKGALFFSDYSRKCIWTMFPGPDGEPDPSQRATFASGLPLVELKVGPGGDLFYADFLGGAIRRIRYFAENVPPVAKIDASATSGVAPLAVSFDGSGSTDANPADVLSFSWDLDGDGVFGDSTQVAPLWVYGTAGVYPVSLQVTDVAGDSGVASVDITVDDTPPVAAILAPDVGVTFAVGDEVPFEGAATDAQDGDLPPAAFRWALVQEHCPDACHQHPLQEFEGVSGGSFVAPDHEFPSFLTLVLTVTDSAGLTDSASIEIHPRTVTIGFESVPPGLSIAVGGTSEVAPFEREVIVGSVSSVGVEGLQVLGGVAWKFVAWSDGGAASHSIVGPEMETTLTATFSAACGDGVMDPGEQCDPGSSQCCSAACKLAVGVCDDDDPCTKSDRCVAGVCKGVKVSCSDGNRCTDDVCEPGLGCLHTFNAVPCSDGDACTAGDLCAGGACLSGAPLSCADGNPCTSEACDGRRGCTYAPNFGGCDDGDACTWADGCKLGRCVGRFVDCADGDPCTLDACDPVVGCTHQQIPGCSG